MAFVVANGLSDEGTSQSVGAGGMKVYDRCDPMVHFELSINLMNDMENSLGLSRDNTAYTAPFEKPQEYIAHVLPLLSSED